MSVRITPQDFSSSYANQNPNSTLFVDTCSKQQEITVYREKSTHKILIHFGEEYPCVKTKKPQKFSNVEAGHVTGFEL